MEHRSSSEAKDSSASQEIPRNCITAFTRARHLSISQARSVKFKSPFYFLEIHFNIILLTTPLSSKWSLIRFPHQTPVCWDSTSN
jgi:hypothetical protein